MLVEVTQQGVKRAEFLELAEDELYDRLHLLVRV